MSTSNENNVNWQDAKVLLKFLQTIRQHQAHLQCSQRAEAWETVRADLYAALPFKGCFQVVASTLVKRYRLIKRNHVPSKSQFSKLLSQMIEEERTQQATSNTASATEVVATQQQPPCSQRMHLNWADPADMLAVLQLIQKHKAHLDAHRMDAWEQVRDDLRQLPRYREHLLPATGKTFKQNYKQWAKDFSQLQPSALEHEQLLFAMLTETSEQQQQHLPVTKPVRIEQQEAMIPQLDCNTIHLEPLQANIQGRNPLAEEVRHGLADIHAPRIYLNWSDPTDMLAVLQLARKHKAHLKHGLDAWELVRTDLGALPQYQRHTLPVTSDTYRRKYREWVKAFINKKQQPEAEHEKLLFDMLNEVADLAATSALLTQQQQQSDALVGKEQRTVQLHQAPSSPVDLFVEETADREHPQQKRLNWSDPADVLAVLQLARKHNAHVDGHGLVAWKNVREDLISALYQERMLPATAQAVQRNCKQSMLHVRNRYRGADHQLVHPGADASESEQELFAMLVAEEEHSCETPILSKHSPSASPQQTKQMDSASLSERTLQRTEACMQRSEKEDSCHSRDIDRILMTAHMNSSSVCAGLRAAGNIAAGDAMAHAEDEEAVAAGVSRTLTRWTEDLHLALFHVCREHGVHKTTRGISFEAKWEAVRKAFYALPATCCSLKKTAKENLYQRFHKRKREVQSKFAPAANKPCPSNASKVEKLLYEMLLEEGARGDGGGGIINWSDATIVLPILSVVRKHNAHVHEYGNQENKWEKVAKELRQLPQFQNLSIPLPSTIRSRYLSMCKEVQDKYSPAIAKPVPQEASMIEEAVYTMMVESMIHKAAGKDTPVQHNVRSLPIAAAGREAIALTPPIMHPASDTLRAATTTAFAVVNNLDPDLSLDGAVDESCDVVQCRLYQEALLVNKQLSIVHDAARIALLLELQHAKLRTKIQTMQCLKIKAQWMESYNAACL